MGQTGDRGLGESGPANGSEVVVCADDGVQFRMVVAVDRSIARLGVVALLEGRMGVVVARHGTPQSTARWLATGATDGAIMQLDTTAACELWHEWRLDEIMREALPSTEAEVSGALVMAALVVQRLVDPGSKLAAVRWFPRTCLPELLGVEEKQFNNTRVHRVLDDLEAATPALMAKLARRYHERDGSFTATYLDVTDVSFVGNGPNLAVIGKNKSGQIRRNVGIVLMCNQRGYPLRWQIVRGNCTDGEAMLEMLDSVSGLEWANNAPIVMDRAMGRSAYIRTMIARNVKFLTALVRTEYMTYAPKLPWQAMQDLEIPGKGDKDSGEATTAILKMAASHAIQAGMEKVDDTLFVMDFGLVELAVGEKTDTFPEGPENDDTAIRAIWVAQKIRQSVADGRYDSRRAAARALGIERGTAGKYARLLKLSDEIQRSILDGQVVGWPLATLLRIARIDGRDQQLLEFESLRQSGGPPRSSSANMRVSATKTSTPKGTPPLKVRVVGYFNPQHFIDNRRKENRKRQSIKQFAIRLNKKLAQPQSTMGPKRIFATVDSRLRRDDLITRFEVDVSKKNIEGRRRYQLSMEPRQDKWQQARRYDGFSVLVASPNVTEPAVELCKRYRAKDMVEKDFQAIKGVLDISPVRHRTDQKVSAHVTICMLALLLERTLRQKLLGTCTAVRALEALKHCCLNRYRSADGPSLYVVTETDQEQTSLLRKLRLSYLADDDYMEGKLTPQ